MGTTFVCSCWSNHGIVSQWVTATWFLHIWYTYIWIYIYICSLVYIYYIYIYINISIWYVYIGASDSVGSNHVPRTTFQSPAFDHRMALLLVAGAELECTAPHFCWQRWWLYKVCVTHLPGKQPTLVWKPITYAACITCMESSPSFTLQKSPSFVGKYTNHGEYGRGLFLEIDPWIPMVPCCRLEGPDEIRHDDRCYLHTLHYRGMLCFLRVVVFFCDEEKQPSQKHPKKSTSRC